MTEFANRLWKAFRDIWLVAVALVGAIISAYNIVSQLSETGRFEGNVQIAIGVLLFLFFGSIAMIKSFREARLAEEKLEKTKGNSQEQNNRIDTVSESSQAVLLSNSPNSNVSVNQNKKELPPPTLSLKISDGNQFPNESIVLYLNPLPEKPNIEYLISEKRNELLNKAKNVVSTNPHLGMRLNVERLIKDYPNRVEKYIKKYMVYLNSVYQESILEERYKILTLTLEIQGMRPVTNVFILLRFPDDFPFPPQYINERKNSGFNFRNSDGERYKKRFPLEPPEEPKVTFPDTLPVGTFEKKDYYEQRNEKRYTGKLELSIENYAKFNINNLVHNLAYNNFPTIPMWLENSESKERWILNYEIYANEIENSPITGILEIKVEIK